jgi:hypothetical protein
VKRRSWLPDTLFGRNVLLIVGLIVAAQLGVSTAFFLSVQWPRIAATTRYAIQHVEAMRRALEAMDRAQADQYIAAINATGPTEIVRDAQPRATTSGRANWRCACSDALSQRNCQRAMSRAGSSNHNGVSGSAPRSTAKRSGSGWPPACW